ncbi:MAG: DNA internalization-related competence protein ComEC/Rec2 [Lachnospiraceae bacterium]|nr:DNA internalization-related competence protein ComEC/Rec2 [Lachnospiraceae bacterium]
MRRPLCAAGLVFITMVSLLTLKNIGNIRDHSELEGKARTMEGRVSVVEHRDYEDYSVTYVYLKLTERNDPFDRGAVIRCACSGDLSLRPKIGARAGIKGRIQAWSRARNPGMFDQFLYRKALGVECGLKDCEILYVSGDHDRYREFLSEIRNYLGLMLDRVFGIRDGSILRAVALGDKSSLDEETRSMYQRNGIIHILAVSGLHISVLGMGLYGALKKLRVPSFFSVLLSVFFMCSYGLMCGSSASAVRAVTMFSIRMGAVLLKRTYDILTALTAAAIMILASSPLYVTQAGFLFSFTAVLSISAMTPVTDEILMVRSFKGFANKIISAFTSGIDVALATLPIHTGFYYSFPIISLLINLIVIPLMTVVMAGAVISMILGSLYLPMAYIAAFPVKIVLRIYYLLCVFGDHLPVSSVITGCPPVYRIVLYYLILSVPFIIKDRCSPAVFVITSLIAVSLLVFRPAAGFSITFVDVGQGDCIYITDGNGLDILVDGGSSTETGPGERIIAPFLKYNGVGSIEYIFVTHLDSDHYNGITELIEMSSKGGPKIDRVLLNCAVLKNGGEKLEAFSSVCRENGVSICPVRAGDSLVSQRDSLEIHCIYPSSDSGDPEEMNEISTVLAVRYGDLTCLLTGDIEGRGETDLTGIIRRNKELQNADILKLAHHGSKNSSSEDFLSVLSPGISVISAGKNNRYGHPAPETLKRLDEWDIPYLCTIDSGAITFRTAPFSVSRFFSVPSK